MKKMNRIISAVVCLAMLLCALPVQSFAVDVLRNNTNQKVRLYGDIDGDGVVEQSDFEYILAVASGEIEMPEVGSPEYYAADIMGDGITMEDARRCYRFVQGLDNAETYSPDDRELELFNDLVNIIKDYSFFDDRVYYYTYEYEFMETKNLDFGIYTGLIEDAMREEDGTTEKYYALRRSSQKAGYVMSGPGAKVSMLKPENIQDMTIEVGVPCTFSEDINAPAKITVGLNEYDVARFKTQEASYTDCIKMTIEIKNESYVNDIPADIKALAKKQLAEGYEMAEGEEFYLDKYQTALYNMYGTDIIELGVAYPLEQSDGADGVNTRIYAQLGDIKTAGSLIFYFDRATLNPIAASYTVETDIDQHVEMSMGLGSFKIEGEMDPRNLMIAQTNYWFCGYFS
ncbi:MAG: hypothetical protein E7523_04190 [Ruminococcaceae bacterium]|nr:hypothetical protein [Oscillospiraceae bacterium]